MAWQLLLSNHQAILLFPNNLDKNNSQELYNYSCNIRVLFNQIINVFKHDSYVLKVDKSAIPD